MGMHHKNRLLTSIIFPLSFIGGLTMASLSQPAHAAQSTDPQGIRSVNWSIVNDTVMGGRSSADLAWGKNGVLVWTGNLSLANNGGFVSIRADNLKLDWSSYDGIEVVLEGGGRDIQVTLQRRDMMIRAGGYRALVPTNPQGETKIFIPFSAFVLKRFGRRIQGPELSSGLANLGQKGLLMADKREGNFRIVLKSIRPVLSSADHKLAPNVADVLVKAIERGVPTFNGGDAEGCASIYREALSKLEKAGDLGVGTWASQRATQALMQARQQASVDAAWTLRRAMDGILGSLSF